MTNLLNTYLAEPPPLVDGEVMAPLEEILCTEKLAQRPARLPDFQKESLALVALVQALADSPRTILQTLAEKILEVLNAGSAGLSLLNKEDGGKRFYWPAIAGLWKAHIGGGTPRDFSPCGDVLDRNTPLLFCHVERRYTYFRPVTPPVEECLLVPFYVEGKAMGTIWAVAHDGSRKFDAEDLRLLERLGRFASAAYQGVESLNRLEHREDDLRQSHAELLHRMIKIQQCNHEAEESHRKLRESERRFREMIDALPAAIYTTDAEGRITHFNPAAVEFFGCPLELGTDWWCPSRKLYRADGTPLPKSGCPMAIALKDGLPVRGRETILERPDGTRLWFTPYPTPLRDPEGRIVGAINMLVDITGRMEAEEVVRQANHALANQAAELNRLVIERTAKLQESIDELEHFSYTITHDMSAPSRSMQAFATILLKDADNRLTPESADYLRRIMNASRRMEDLIRDSLQYAKAIRERIPLAAIDPAQVLRGILQSYFGLESAQLDIQVVEPLPAVMANEAGLGQCFANLLDNALKFVKPGDSPRVRIWAENRPPAASALGTKEAPGSGQGTVRFWFEDNGIGIRPEYQDRIFGMFQQLTKNYDGTGIGLALVRKTAQRMDGKVGVESELGKGSRFWLEFPAAINQQSDNPLTPS